MFRKFLLPLFGILGATALLQAAQPQSDFRLSAGWRSDQIKTFIVASGTPTGETQFRELFSDNLQVRDIRIAQIGLQGQLAVPNCCCDLSTWWLSQFYVKGYGYWGHVYNGRYSAFDKKIPDVVANRTGNLGDVHGGKSRNYNLGIGWVYPATEDWGLGFSGGYQYDRLDVKVKNMLNVAACTIDTVPNPDTCSATAFNSLQEGLNYKTKWKGPWVGANVIFATCNYCFDLGYEYHMIRWNARFQLSGADLAGTTCSGFSDKRSGRRGHGNVIYAEAGTYFVECLEVVLGAKYTSFSIAGRQEPANNTFAGLGCPADEIAKVRHNKWRSFQVTLDIGYQF